MSSSSSSGSEKAAGFFSFLIEAALSLRSVAGAAAGVEDLPPPSQAMSGSSSSRGLLSAGAAAVVVFLVDPDLGLVLGVLFFAEPKSLPKRESSSSSSPKRDLLAALAGAALAGAALAGSGVFFGASSSSPKRSLCDEEAAGVGVFWAGDWGCGSGSLKATVLGGGTLPLERKENYKPCNLAERE